MHITSMLGLMYICKNVRECVLARVCVRLQAHLYRTVVSRVALDL